MQLKAAPLAQQPVPTATRSHCHNQSVCMPVCLWAEHCETVQLHIRDFVHLWSLNAPLQHRHLIQCTMCSALEISHRSLLYVLQCQIHRKGVQVMCLPTVV